MLIDWTLLFIPGFCFFMAWLALCAYFSNARAVDTEWGRMRRCTQFWMEWTFVWASTWAIAAVMSLAMILWHYYKVVNP